MKANISYALKKPVQGRDFTMQEFSCSIESEIHNSSNMEQELDTLYNRVKGAVENQYNKVENTNALVNDTFQNPPEPEQIAQASPHQPAEDRVIPVATSKQVNLLKSLAKRIHMSETDLDELALDRYTVRLRSLNIKQASDLIEELMASGGKAA